MISAILNTSALTNKGMVRNNNEDNYTLHNEAGVNNNSTGPGTLLMVADGMGGAEAGEIASGIAVESVKRAFSSLPMHEYHDVEITNLIKKFLLDAHYAIVEDARRNPRRQGMGTTAVVVWVYDGKAFIGWSGDSRCYVQSRNRGFELVTRDHSHVWEQYLSGGYDSDLAEKARLDDHSNIITQCLGDEGQDPRPEVELRRLQEGDRLILCSDGLNSMISDRDIEQIAVDPGGSSPKLVCDSLVRAANAAGGHDNVTVIVSDVLKLTGAPLAERAFKESTPKTLEFGGGARKTAAISKQQWILFGLVMVAAFALAGLFLYDSMSIQDIGSLEGSKLNADTILEPKKSISEVFDGQSKDVDELQKAPTTTQKPLGNQPIVKTNQAPNREASQTPIQDDVAKAGDKINTPKNTLPSSPKPKLDDSAAILNKLKSKNFSEECKKQGMECEDIRKWAESEDLNPESVVAALKAMESLNKKFTPLPPEGGN
ncbi:MAG: serine/threonine-protein phosphatase [Saprospiraceae bacterium]|nr:serine/threonine-protein phosphatase [Saprospiraceae bacterium]MCB0542389.1 serine/threonine-protein phosphatase [Saprospiraceae bacterium]MCB0574656.1 serine/threonine-protein phosphatase [Saprospiraceae bacterium]MCB9307630.1 serine/threonine-protein phosphatase [Lewinellaceae bacterium]MCB9354504.1 serine/threonine-protein phosphatase [Lewinellaceae bacterium]